MASTYENVIYDRILTGVEKLLEAEFKSSLLVYQNVTPQNKTRTSIRIWPSEEPMELIGRMAVAQTYRYSVDCTLVARASQRGRSTTDARLEIISRAMRILNDNCAYSPSGVYQWHDGVSEDLEELTPGEDETFEEGWRFVYRATVTEAIG